MPLDADRRALLLAPLLATFAASAEASPLNPQQTIIRPPADHQWIPNKGYPERSVDMCPLTGDTNQPGLYYTLVRWWPGYMSAPHTYTTDRFCIVVSGTWWCNSGPTSTRLPASRSRQAVLSVGLRRPRTTMASSRDTPSPQSSPSAALVQSTTP